MQNNKVSFSIKVKEEIINNFPAQRHCRIAEIASIIACSGRITPNALIVECENERITQKYFTLLKKTFNIKFDAFEQKGLFSVVVKNKEDVLTILQAVNILNGACEYQPIKGLVSDVLLKNSCCKRAFLKTVFQFIGTVSDPLKSKQLEYVCTNENHANQIMRILNYFELDAKINVRRNKYYVVYVRSKTAVGDFLRIVEAPLATIEYEQAMVLKEVANKTNRQNNCDVANSAKAIDAAYKQLEDIKYLNECIGLENLSEQLQSVAKIRLENPDLGLKDLGELMTPPLGKSGVNHRLRKISELAQKYREKDT